MSGDTKAGSAKKNGLRSSCEGYGFGDARQYVQAPLGDLSHGPTVRCNKRPANRICQNTAITKMFADDG